MEKQTIESLLENVEFNTLTQIYKRERKTHPSFYRTTTKIYIVV